MSKLYVIGVGFRPLDERAREIVLNSHVILANNRLMEVFEGYNEFEKVKDKVKVINNVDDTIDFIKSQISNHSPLKRGVQGCVRIVLLASGDPLFFGIGRRAIKEFGKDKVEILPDLSSAQTAFSRIKEVWSDALFISLHGGPDPKKRRRLEYEIEDIPALLQRHNKISILTDKENNPSAIAKVLSSSLVTRHSSLMVYVCEKLGYPDEKITEGAPEEIAKMSFQQPNLVIIQGLGIGDQGLKIGFGLKENEISHSRGLITKDEARAITIHKLRLPEGGVFWDIGSGSGSVSIEAVRLCRGLKAFAVEKNKEQIENIKKNKDRFNIAAIKIIEGEAPEALSELPQPDRVFIGGSGGRLNEILDVVKEKMTSGIVVVNAATIETLNEAVRCLEDRGFSVEITEVSISRSKTIGGKRHLSALNPVFIVCGERQ
ncbi:MAG: precorrin-6y C5,15-methyltransferase (decarboxylating) subunit CbiE [Nitrospirae bacterium]|nr:precorrin-6y C5,15-methyltransferase (decarboxylating) subunit CbiE [Nitrospirota bacterium]